MTARSSGGGWYLERAGGLLHRHGPDAPGTMSPTDRIHLRYMWNPMPAEREHEARIVAGGVGFGVAMRVLFECMGLEPITQGLQVHASTAVKRLGVGLLVNGDDLAPALHARLLAMVEEDAPQEGPY